MENSGFLAKRNQMVWVLLNELHSLIQNGSTHKMYPISFWTILFVWYHDKSQLMVCHLFFVITVLHAGNSNSIKNYLKILLSTTGLMSNSLAPAHNGSWVLQMRIHQLSSSSYSLHQHCYILNALHFYDLLSKFPERDSPFSANFTVIKDNCPVATTNLALVKQKQQMFFPSAPAMTVSTPLDLALY